MGTLKNGPFSGFTGRTGSLVGSRKNGKWMMAAVKATGTRPPTVKQLNQQIRFGLITGWLSGITSLIRTTFTNYDSEMTAMNYAVQWNLKNAVTGVSPNYTIDFQKTILSRGQLEPAAGLGVVAAEVAELKFSWSPNLGRNNGKDSDDCIFMVYNPLKGRWLTQYGAVTRAALQYTLSVPAEYSGDTLHIWFAFISEDGKLVSTSYYLGALPLL
ncbi:hypothetical protein ACVWYN_003598 [Pedobacter sp. UYP24]